ncbi:MAG: hypothetical protein HN350_12860 [Phycisphaerales bacterium]|jgi:hypothetical protein|nr:hypothetical protein [Phycisphaerales bacterium]
MIATMSQWWSEMETVTQVFYVAASFFSVILIWQFVASLIGLSGGDMDLDGLDGGLDADIDFDGDFDVDVAAGSDAMDSMDAFSLFSLRAILAFCTLFFWAGAMYFDQGVNKSLALAYAFGWGLAAWGVITVLVNWMKKLAETGTSRIASCVGTRGSVYLDIPTGGTGKVRVVVTGAISMVTARSIDDKPIKAGAPVEVVRKIDASTVEVKTITAQKTEDSTSIERESE